MPVSIGALTRARRQLKIETNAGTLNVVYAPNALTPAETAAERKLLLERDVDPFRTACRLAQEPRCPQRQVGFRVHPGNIIDPLHHAVGADSQAHGVAEIDKANHGLQQVVAIGTPTDSRSAPIIHFR